MLKNEIKVFKNTASLGAANKKAKGIRREEGAWLRGKIYNRKWEHVFLSE
jgi:hypothetical protein